MGKQTKYLEEKLDRKREIISDLKDELQQKEAVIGNLKAKLRERDSYIINLQKAGGKLKEELDKTTKLYKESVGGHQAPPSQHPRQMDFLCLSNVWSVGTTVLSKEF